MKLYNFYHIYADGKWLIPLREYLKALSKSGLKNRLEGLYIGIMGTDFNRFQVESFLKVYCYFYNLTYTIVAHSHIGWEQTTLDKLYEFSLNHEGYVLYAHTKGASNNSEPNPSWRKSMTYFNVMKWEETIDKLKNYQAVGCHWILPEDVPVNGYYFAGNFWWAHLSLIRTLDRPLRNVRYEAELWLGNKYHTDPFAIYDLNPGFPRLEIFKKDL